MCFQNNPSNFSRRGTGLSVIPAPRGDSRPPLLFSLLKRALFIAGAGMLGYAVFTIAESYVMQRYETLQFDRTLALPANLRPKHAVSDGPIGKLTIPSAGISAIVLEGADSGLLKVAPGHIPGTALPGEDGNVAIAGHRDTFFRNLEAIRNGDSVLLTTPKGTYEYKVDSTEVVDPARTDVLEPSGSPALTLVTCYPFHWIGSAPKRFIVRAHLIRPIAWRKL
jgi:sortase A